MRSCVQSTALVVVAVAAADVVAAAAADRWLMWRRLEIQYQRL